MLKIDLHIHSIHSGHAYGTIYDIMRDAKSKGMEMIAITDHGPSMLGASTHIHFMMFGRSPKDHDGMEVLWGCEANIIDGEGSIDLDEKIVKKIDLLLLGLHLGTPYKDLGEKRNTEAVIKCFRKHPIHIFVHPATLFYKYDVEKVYQAACDNNILLEMNLANLAMLEDGDEKIRFEDLKKMVDIAKKNKKKIIVNSDAHFLHEIGDDSLLKKYWDRLGLDESMIINNYPDELRAFIKSKKLQKR
ncbi:hypothetical protein COV19_03745 [Candidatus Woesearchaeota archaeon CG10_big_fil_rev_8_21_14_0_10_44_13]|nr:MAG: hypothetical protein COV19_03745 [Candidatus Woesearchaeota archaeon CG10_big_fil_rev_8_21_14_0_10_44_13]